MIVSYGYGKPSYAPEKTITGSHQQLVVSYGYGALLSASATVPLKTLDAVLRVSRNLDAEVVA
jgi:hypothetical protein